ncbi:MAG TPA: sulfite exporter TauE/SafE family protein [Ferruginibacter sp.]|nr:sulfite exporter TauE/SafE family protein [Ferruginibacter sp.]HMP21818.1 sulfite exporter TauE/SafE family protein [Ferruginibacter sp.]
MEYSILFYTLLFIIAFLYAAVGHGGASGYLALMAVFGIAPAVMKPTALLLNIFVSATAFIQFYRGRHFMPKLFLPLALASVPMAFVGGMIGVDVVVYKKILGLLLLLPIARFLFWKDNVVIITRPYNTVAALIIGAVIGLLSGMIGIGGGIILSPVLLMLHWTNQKQAAAISALFIFVNSLAGLAGLMTKGIQLNAGMYGYVAAAFAGGLGGAYFGAIKFKQQVLKYILSAVLILAVYKLLFTGA